MPDIFKERITHSFGKRLASSIAGIGSGFLLLFIGIYALWANEGSYLKEAKNLDFGRKQLTQEDVYSFNNQYDGELIHVISKATTADILKDEILGVEANALKISRNVKMYQWEESKKSTKQESSGGSQVEDITYSYNKIWSEKLIDSNQFKHKDGHRNPSQMNYQSKTFVSSNINLAGYLLTEKIIEKINFFVEYNLPQNANNLMHPSLRKVFKAKPTGYFYGNQNNPEIGAIDITYSIVPQSYISVIAQQSGNQLNAYKTPFGNLALVSQGKLSSDEMFESALSENESNTWIFRFIGLIIVFVATALILRPLSLLLSVIPFVGGVAAAIVELGVGFFSVIITVFTIGLAWLFYRPLISFGLLLLVVIMIYYKISKSRLSTEKLQKTTI